MKTEVQFDPCVSQRVRALLTDKSTPQWTRDSFGDAVRKAKEHKHPKEELNPSILLEYIDDLQILITAAVWHYQDSVSEYLKRTLKELNGVDPDIELRRKSGSMVVKRIGLPQVIVREFFGEDEDD